VSRPRVLLADDHSLVLEGIRKLLDTKVDLVGTVGDGRALVKAVEDTKVDVVLLDISMPLLNGIEAARQIKKISPHTKLIFLTMHSDRDYVIETLRIGASGYLLKWSAEAELVTAINAVMDGGVISPPRCPILLRSFRHDRALSVRIRTRLAFEKEKCFN